MISWNASQLAEESVAFSVRNDEAKQQYDYGILNHQLLTADLHAILGESLIPVCCLGWEGQRVAIRREIRLVKHLVVCGGRHEQHVPYLAPPRR